MEATSKPTVRSFDKADVPELIQLMRGLARFEGYIDDFRVAEQDLIEHGLGSQRRFEAFVAQESGAGPLLGMAVVYLIPWTYDLRSTMVLKELFVTDAARGRGLGKALMKHVARRAAEQGCPRLLWTVLHSNNAAVCVLPGVGCSPRSDLARLGAGRVRHTTSVGGALSRSPSCDPPFRCGSNCAVAPAPEPVGLPYRVPQPSAELKVAKP